MTCNTLTWYKVMKFDHDFGTNRKSLYPLRTMNSKGCQIARIPPKTNWWKNSGIGSIRRIRRPGHGPSAGNHDTKVSTPSSAFYTSRFLSNKLWQHIFKLRCFSVVDVIDHISEPFLRIDIVFCTSCKKAVEHGYILGRIVRAGKTGNSFVPAPTGGLSSHQVTVDLEHSVWVK